MRLMNRRPGRTLALVLAVLPFLVLIVAYAVSSEIRLAANPNDKLLPAFTTMAEAVGRIAFAPDPRSGDYLMPGDTLASLSRLLAALAIATAVGLVFGLTIGLLPMAKALLAPLVAAICMIPPLAVLPILFIVMGLGEAAKVALIAIGITPFVIRDLSLRAEEVPAELLIKAQTLGASTWQVAVRVMLPQLLPRLLDAVRMSLGPAWLFLIAAEAIASESGLGYRIFLVRRYLSMDIILPYVAWITLIAFLMDMGLRALQRAAFPWFAERAR